MILLKEGNGIVDGRTGSHNGGGKMDKFPQWWRENGPVPAMAVEMT